MINEQTLGIVDRGSVPLDDYVLTVIHDGRDACAVSDAFQMIAAHSNHATDNFLIGNRNDDRAGQSANAVLDHVQRDIGGNADTPALDHSVVKKNVHGTRSRRDVLEVAAVLPHDTPHDGRVLHGHADLADQWPQ